jgi:hypothetical protein
MIRKIDDYLVAIQSDHLVFRRELFDSYQAGIDRENLRPLYKAHVTVCA